MRDLGTPVYSPRLFQEVLGQFDGRAHVHVVRLGTQPVAAGLTFRTRATSSTLGLVDTGFQQPLPESSAVLERHRVGVGAGLRDSGLRTLDTQ